MVSNKKFSLFDFINYSFMLFLIFLFVLPLWSVVVVSVVSEAERFRRGMFIFYPQELNFTAYMGILKKGSDVYTGYGVTIFRATVGTACNMVVTTLMAYSLSKRGLFGRTFFTFFVYFTMLFNGGLVPTFLVVKYTGLYNSLWAYIIPGLVSAWNLLLMRNFFMQVPDALEEAALIDGASPPTVLFRIVLPLSVPSLVTIALFYMVGHWNSWFDGIIYIQRRNMLTLQNILREIIMASSTIESNLDLRADEIPPLEAVKGAAIIVSTLPILLVYPFLQKYFVKGVMIGSIKG